MEIKSTNEIIFTTNEKVFFEDMKAAVRNNENLTLHVDEMRGLLKSLTGEEIAPAVWMPYSELEDIPRGAQLWGYYEDGLVRKSSKVEYPGGTIETMTRDETLEWDRENQPTHITYRYNDVKPEPPVNSQYQQIKKICKTDANWFTKQNIIWNRHQKIWNEALKMTQDLFTMSAFAFDSLNEHQCHVLCDFALKIAQEDT